MDDAPTHHDPAGLALARADALIAVHRWEDAAREARRALAADPANAAAHARIGQCLLELERWDDALAAAEQAVACDPTMEWGHRLRALALLNTDRLDDALHAAQETVRLAPEALDPLHTLLSAQYARAARGDPAVADAARAAVVDTAAHLARAWPGHVQTHVDLARVTALARDWPAMEAHARRALVLAPTDSRALAALGTALDYQERRPDAMRAYADAVAADPTFVDAQQHLNALLALDGARAFSPLLLGLIAAAAVASIRPWGELAVPALVAAATALSTELAAVRARRHPDVVIRWRDHTRGARARAYLYGLLPLSVGVVCAERFVRLAVAPRSVTLPDLVITAALAALVWQFVPFYGKFAEEYTEPLRWSRWRRAAATMPVVTDPGIAISTRVAAVGAAMAQARSLRASRRGPDAMIAYSRAAHLAQSVPAFWRAEADGALRWALARHVA